MRRYLIDHENVQNHGLYGHGFVEKASEIYLFYSGNIAPTDGCYQMIKLKHAGKNALDFQIMTQLATMISKEPDGSFYVISKDQGYKAGIEELEVLYPHCSIMLEPSIYDTFDLVEKDLFQYMMDQKDIPVETKPEKKKTNQTIKAKGPVVKNQTAPKMPTKELKATNQKEKTIKLIVDKTNIPKKVKPDVKNMLMIATSRTDLNSDLGKKYKAKGQEYFKQLKGMLGELAL